MKPRYKPRHVRRKIALQNAFKLVFFALILWGITNLIWVLIFKDRYDRLKYEMEQSEKSIKESERRIKKLRGEKQ